MLLGLDLVSVLVFVIVGRDSHDAGGAAEDVLATSAPFLIGAAVGWAITRAWRRPLAMPVGIGVVVSTVIVGMTLRRFAFDDGTAPSFVLVTTGFFAATQLGWRWAVARASDLGHR